MEFRKVLISELSPAAYNPRKKLQPKDPEYQRIKRSIEEFGYVDPVIVNSDYTIIGGHQRVAVLQELGETQIDVVIVDIPKVKEKALNVALNKITGEWDMEQLSIVLSELKEADFDISITGFTDKELKDIDAELFGKQAKEDDYEPPPEIKTDIKRGDIFQLGKHRLMCGDSTSKEDVGRLMDGTKADMVFTDPPYGVSYGDKNKFLNAIGRGNHIQTPIENDTMKPEETQKVWIGCWQAIFPSLTDGCSYYICSADADLLLLLLLSLRDNDLPPHQCIIWVKNNIVLGRRDYNAQHETMVYGWKGGAAHRFYGAGGESTVWKHDKPHESKLHPTMKPVEVVAHAINNSSVGGNAVLDPFLGSGTTLIACEQLGRICYGMEISPQYCEVICQRFEKLTNVKRQKVSG